MLGSGSGVSEPQLQLSVVPSIAAVLRALLGAGSSAGMLAALVHYSL